jgi:ubiquinone/menaquinone biosynthesis C-methylase UbiE
MLERFDKLAKEWDSKPMRVQSALQFVDGIISIINKDLSDYSLLDYGCGSGLVSFGFKDMVKNIVGMDYSVGMINRFNEKVHQLGYDNIISKKHNINIDNLDHNIFDMAVTNMTMHHIKDYNMFIKKLTNSVKKNGYVCIADLEVEDGTFHTDGNNGVEHFGFDKFDIYRKFYNNGLVCLGVETLHTINKEGKCYKVFIAIGRKR